MHRSGCIRGFAIVAALALCGAAAAQESSTSSEDEQILETVPVDQEQTAPPPEAAESDEDLDEQVFYSGMGVSRVGTDFDNLGEAINLDIVIGFRIPTVKWVGLELDIGQTLIPGEYRDPEPGSPATQSCSPVPTPNCGQPAVPAEEGARDPDGDEFAMQALGISLAFKSTGKFYAMGKYGYRYLATSNETINESRSGNGFGIGAGYRWGKGLSGVELSYKELSENVDALALTFFARFNRP